MKNKSKKRQNIGNRSASEGIAYQCMAATSLVLRMFLYEEYENVQQNNNSYVDDILSTEKSKNENFFQCKINGGLSSGGFTKEQLKEIIESFYKQYQVDNNRGKTKNRYVLFSRNQPNDFAKIIETISKGKPSDKSWEEYLNANLSQKNLNLFKEIYSILAKFKEISLDSTLSQGETPKTKATNTIEVSLTKEEFIEFLKRIDFWTRDVKVIKDDFYKQLEKQGYPKYVYHILNTTLSYEWLSKEITKTDVVNLLKEFGISFISGTGSGTAPITPKRPHKGPRISGGFLLLKVNERFYKKLKELLAFIDGSLKLSPVNKKNYLEAITKNPSIAWHFLRNQKDDRWFSDIKNNLMVEIARNSIDLPIKYQLLSYFEKCTHSYSDDLIPLLVEFYDNAKNPNILTALVKLLGELKPSRKQNLRPVWKILSILSEHQHPWVRKEIPDALKKLAEYDLDKGLKILKKIFLLNSVPRNVTQGSPTLSLTFQGSDNENWVFEQSARVLAELMLDQRYTERVINLACELEIVFVRQEEEKREIIAGVILDYSYIWLGERDPLDRIEYQYDKKKRIALELEKFLMIIAPKNTETANNIFSKLLKNKYEVFYLIVINVLIKNAEKYLPITASIVFNRGLWRNYNLQNYFLQKLIRRYFELDQSRINEFIKVTLTMSSNGEKREAYFKQDLLVSIPETYRTNEVNNELEKLEKILQVPAKIKPSFKITSWSGPQPDTTIKELKQKSIDELINVMEQSSANKRKSDPYDLAPLFASMVKEKSELINQILEHVSGKIIAPDFLGQMVRAYIEVKNKNWEEIFIVFWKLDKTQDWARMEVARFFEKECGQESIKSISSELLNKVKQILFDLVEDKDPNDDESLIRSSHPSPENGITRGINTIRGVATEALVVLLFYYPDDSDIAEKIKSISEDKVTAIRATLIYNLRFLTGKKYDFCDAIIKKFVDTRNSEIDFALIHYFASLNPEKFKSKESSIKLVLNNQNERIQDLLGELIGSRYLSNFPIKPLLDSILKGAIGEVHARRSIAFIFESRLEKIINTNKQKQVIDYLKKLLDPQIEPDLSVRERASFFFERSETKPEHFPIFYKSRIFDVVIKDIMNVSAQNHLIEYLERCISANQSIERCVEVLHKQTMNNEGVWADHLIIQKIASILRKLFDTPRQKKSIKERMDNIFNKGLQMGWDEFYNIFNDFYSGNKR